MSCLQIHMKQNPFTTILTFYSWAWVGYTPNSFIHISGFIYLFFLHKNFNPSFPGQDSQCPGRLTRNNITQNVKQVIKTVNIKIKNNHILLEDKNPTWIVLPLRSFKTIVNSKPNKPPPLPCSRHPRLSNNKGGGRLLRRPTLKFMRQDAAAARNPELNCRGLHK